VYSNWECIIVDGSPDETEIISQNAAKDSRFNYATKKWWFSEKENAGLEIATGDFVQFLC
jgi:glycosyltransferase involved in cell wall biosynthesis